MGNCWPTSCANIETVRLFLTWARETELVNGRSAASACPLRTGKRLRWMSRLADGPPHG